MAAPWFALFSAIPWSDVISHAPTIAKGAKKLWQKVANRPPTDTASAPESPPAIRPDERLAALEFRLAESDVRQQESAELLAALAGQNADLVRATEELRRRVRSLSIMLGLTFAAALTALIVGIARHF